MKCSHAGDWAPVLSPHAFVCGRRAQASGRDTSSLARPPPTPPTEAHWFDEKSESLMEMRELSAWTAPPKLSTDVLLMKTQSCRRSGPVKLVKPYPTNIARSQQPWHDPAFLHSFAYWPCCIPLLPVA